MTDVDPRVTEARRHWSFRFTANGTDYADFQATMDRIDRWEDWCREWGRTAQHYEQVAETAERNDSPSTAGGAWRRAALCWHWGKFVFTEDPGQARAAHERTVACYRRGAATLSPPARLVHVPYATTQLAAYLRVPAVERPPVVIMVPGLDSVKEELQATADYFLDRGLAVLAVDGPGQGETEYLLAIEPAYEKVATAIVNFLRDIEEVDKGRVGLYGVSLGGYYAARAAAHETRLSAVIALAGPYRFDEDWDSRPPQSRLTFQARSGSANQEQARERAAKLTLAECARHITQPMLVVHGGRDTLVPARQAERLADEAPGAELAMYPEGNHGVTNQAFESRSRMADWMADRLRAA